MVLDDNNSQTGIELACRKPMYIGHDKTERQIKVIYSTVTGISKTTVSEGRVISVLLRDIYVKDVFVSLFSIWYGLRIREIISIINQWLIDDWKF